MRVLLPPSETKRKGGGNSFFVPENLSFNNELQKTRQEVLLSLVKLSNNLEQAKKNLRVGERAAAEIANNFTLFEQPTLPAVKRYTGVLYDALQFETLADDDRSWVKNNVYIQSALFGLISAADEIPAYRLSASSKLYIAGDPLKKVWKKAHAELDFSGELTLDMRSKDYAALCPVPDAYYFEVLAKSASGEIKALNHFNKAAKGAFVRRIAGFSGASIEELVSYADTAGLTFDESTKTLTLITELQTPEKA